MQFLQTLLAFLFVLGVLIFVHELGHFLVARLHGVRVLRFSLGFDPKIFKFTRGGTEYSIGLIPLGGFVKLAGESVEDARTGEPDEFLSKSKWVRFQVYLAGPVMNLLLAWVLLAGVLSRGADEPLYITSPPVVGIVTPDSPAAAAGVQVGDLIVSINGVAVPTWDSLEMAVLPKANREIEIVVMRQGSPVTLKGTPEAVGRYDIGHLGIGPVLRPQFTVVVEGKPADRAGLRAGDVVLGVDGAMKLDQPSVITRFQKNGGKTIVLHIERAGQPIDIPVTPDADGKVGVTLSTLEVRRIDPTLLQAFALSAEQNWRDAKLIGKTVADLFTAQAPVGQLMGPLAIADLSGSAIQMGWTYLFMFMASISLNLGLINLLPVPVLDGGHIVILGIEGLARRDLSVRVKERVLLVGAALIVLLMVTVIYNDVARFLR